MDKFDMKKFCEEIAVDYSKERIKEVGEVKKEEWRIIKKYVKKNQRILDLCCGPGTFLVPLTKQSYNVEGIDFSKGMLEQATKFSKKEKVKIKTSLGDARNIKRRDKSYDLILLMGDSIGSIPNFKDRQQVFDESYRILKEKGVLVVTLGNRYSSIWWAIKIFGLYLLKLFSKERIELGDWIYELYGKKGKHHNYSKREAIKSLKKSGFKIEMISKAFHKFIFIVRK